MAEKNKDLLAWIQLALSENVGPVTFQKLMRFFGSAEEVLKHIDELASRGGSKRKIKICPEKEAEQQLKRLNEIGGKILTTESPEYPTLLKQISDAPPVLFVLLLFTTCVFGCSKSISIIYCFVIF